MLKQIDNTLVLPPDPTYIDPTYMHKNIKSQGHVYENKSEFLFTFLITNIESRAYSSYVHYVAYNIFLVRHRYIGILKSKIAVSTQENIFLP